MSSTAAASSRAAGTPTSWPAAAPTPGSTRCSSPRRTTSPPPLPSNARGGLYRDEAERMAAPVAQRAAAPAVVLGDPPLHPAGLRDQSLAGRRRRAAAAVARRRPRLHPRLLARAALDDPDGLAAPGADAHADLGACRRPHHRRCGDLFRRPVDRRLDPARRL